jgi:enamine deaminase RidA (YjgF/YER057c/UK114 family)
MKNPDAIEAAVTSCVQALQPSGWPQPRGYANGVMAEGRLVLTGGVVVGWNVAGRFADGFVAQVRQTLENIVTILAEGGARPGHLVCRARPLSGKKQGIGNSQSYRCSGPLT